MLFTAAYFIDLIFPFLVWAGVESVHIAPGKSDFTPLDFVYYPYSHSLLMALVWALVFALAYFWWRGDRRGTWMVFALVLSHWVLGARGTIVLWAFLLFIVLSYLGNLSSPPPNTTVLLVAILSSWLYLPWLAWVDRNRRLVLGLVPP
jgi:hypothetical protein